MSAMRALKRQAEKAQGRFITAKQRKAMKAVADAKAKQQDDKVPA